MINGLKKCIIVLTLFFPCSITADVSLPAIFSSNMVLQRNMALPIWGTSEPGETVTVSLNDQRVITTADAVGTWHVNLSALPAGGPYTLTVSGNNTVTYENVMIGEVWVCSGQSNMAWQIRNSNNPDEEIQAANYPNIRLFSVKRTAAQRPARDVTGTWDVCTPETIPTFSAVAYFFGRRLNKTQNVAVGLINTSWGGTPVEAWTSLSALQAHPEEYSHLDERWTNVIERYSKAQAKFQDTFAKWRAKRDSLRALDQRITDRRPRAPRGPNHPHRPSVLYNGMIAPLIPYAIQGAIWYQGESNANRAYQYRTLFPAMIKNWRSDWGQGDFPFFFVQLANFRAIKENPGDSDWAELREAQQMTLSLPNTGTAVIIDIGEEKDIHPRNKQDVGLRLALAAEAKVYGIDQPYSGPVYRSMKIKGNKVHLRFNHTNGGLKAKDKELKGFAIAGADKKFVWANAEIDGDNVIVWSKEVKKPSAVRYAWADNPVCDLYNGADLPASPFRTDDWAGITADKH